MQAITVTADIYGFIVLFIIMCGSVFKNHSKEKTTVLFRASLATTLVGTAVDVASYLLERVDDNFVSALIVSVLSYILCYVMLLFFSFYMVGLIEQKAVVPRWALIPVVVGLIIDVLLISVGTANGKALYVKAGHVIEGPWGESANVLNFLCILYLCYVLFCYKKLLDTPQVYALGGFLFFPIIDAWITIFTDLDFTYPVLAIAFLIIYVIIQEKEREHV